MTPKNPRMTFHIFQNSNMHVQNAVLLSMQLTLWLVADGREQVGVGGQGRLADALSGAQDGL